MHPHQMYSQPVAYLITFTTRGTRLHGSPKGSVNRNGQYIPVNPQWEHYDASNMKHAPVVLSDEQQIIVRDAIGYYCASQDWYIHAVEVLSNHVHIVVTARKIKPENISSALKAVASRMLHKHGGISQDTKIWTRNASERYLFDEEELKNAIYYVKHQ